MMGLCPGRPPSWCLTEEEELRTLRATRMRVRVPCRVRVSRYRVRCCGWKLSSARKVPPGGSGRIALTALKTSAVSSGSTLSAATLEPGGWEVWGGRRGCRGAMRPEKMVWGCD